MAGFDSCQYVLKACPKPAFDAVPLNRVSEHAAADDTHPTSIGAILQYF
jgi:hypothetical protein